MEPLNALAAKDGRPAIEASGLAFRYALAGGDDAQVAAAEGLDGTMGGLAWSLPPVSLTVEAGSFCVLTGPTGCGKSTLLRACKPELAPQGAFAGTLEVCGATLVDEGAVTNALSQARSALEVGFVHQDPQAQMVCDTVWHELAFSLENLAWPQDAMRRRVAEVAHFFGIAPWVNRRTSELSDGQKQLVNLAAVLALRPRLMLLDEPTAQLDPVARQQFLGMLARVNTELGVTVLMATHLPEEAEPFATQLIELAPLGKAAPLSSVLGSRPCSKGPSPTRSGKEEAAVRLRDAFVRYDVHGPWVLQGFDLDVRFGRVHALVGGNGCGKTTALRVLTGELALRRGKLTNACRSVQALLPQDPKALFVADSAREELAEWQDQGGYGAAEIDAALERFDLTACQRRHPYDLSAGQRQCLALAKLLLCKPKLLLLDEPTKGLDAQACARVVRDLRELAAQGVAIVLTTHDLDVAAAVADDATLLFDGQAACTQELPAFFEENLVWRPHDSSRLFGALQ